GQDRPTVNVAQRTLNEGMPNIDKRPCCTRADDGETDRRGAQRTEKRHQDADVPPVDRNCCSHEDDTGTRSNCPVTNAATNAASPQSPVSANMLRTLSNVKRALRPVPQATVHTASTTSVDNSSRFTAGRSPSPALRQSHTRRPASVASSAGARPKSPLA